VKKQVVLLRVGIDAGCGGIQGPLFEDGTFEFMCIPDNKGVSVHTYGNMVGCNGSPHVSYFPESRRKLMAAQTVHVDPEWETFTYGDPTTPKRSLRHLNPGDFLVFYCGLQVWDSVKGWTGDHRPALYLAGYFEVALAGMAAGFDKKTLKSQFGMNFHVRYPSVFQQQQDDLVLVKGGSGSRLFKKACQISVEGKDCSGKPLKVLSPAMQKVFGTFGGRVSIQRSPPRWVEPGFVDRAVGFLRPGVMQTTRSLSLHARNRLVNSRSGFLAQTRMLCLSPWDTPFSSAGRCCSGFSSKSASRACTSHRCIRPASTCKGIGARNSARGSPTSKFTCPVCFMSLSRPRSVWRCRPSINAESTCLVSK
jgi:hypothetical protein